jgi:aminopeptidase
MGAEREAELAAALAELAVRSGANVQPGQIVALHSEPGKEQLARAITAAAYAHGAKFVDLAVFDVHMKRARALHADPSTLEFVPPWYGERVRALGEARAALVHRSGPVAPDAMAGVESGLAGLDMLPRLPESSEVIDARTVNWTIVPCPTPGWAQLVFPELEAARALERLWDVIAHVCRIDEADPVAAWERRFDALEAVAERLDALDLDAVRFDGPGTELEIGLLPGSRWLAARFETVDGITHTANIPSEEVFTTPDPERVNGTVRATKPLFTSGITITGLEVTFEAGRASRVAADEGAGALLAMVARDEGAARLGEIALVDGEGRIGRLGTIFYDTLLDENAASHIALGHGYEAGVSTEEDLARMNNSVIHVDFMIGGDDVAVTGVTRDRREVPLLRGGVWQV